VEFSIRPTFVSGAVLGTTPGNALTFTILFYFWPSNTRYLRR
jgi:hypothetical protein